ncbi:hypothetical protein SAMN05443637_10261 [Pseudonocardia thermophila]|jgi:hypothetical protein|uniref:Uncharacterized protein n=2 Tax=Pseudonocardia thermophila TaxID=1848 RepID=A0A1M6P5N6_PSETH|nr:hypothetical protein [Pseudonocardia thermophila]SHK03251.1 hypothetical protein SAMN05443637_10261 [Pseudonocardia thermophila]
MVTLTARLPMKEGVACCAALDDAVKDLWCAPEPVARSGGQIMADTLVERLTGQARARDVNLEVLALVDVAARIDPAADSADAWP